MKVWAVVVAGGLGRRYSQEIPKQFSTLNHRFLFSYGLQTLLEHEAIAGVVVTLGQVPVTSKLAYKHWVELCERYHSCLRLVEGGAERVWSVQNGVMGLFAQDDWHVGTDDFVLVHDGARPCVHSQDVSRLVLALQSLADVQPLNSFGVMLGRPVTDSLKRVHSGTIAGAVDRSTLWHAQTPQGFNLGALKRAFELLTNQPHSSLNLPTDECEMMSAQGVAVHCVQSYHPNPKLTFLDDLPIIEFLINAMEAKR